jgi:chloramphenicol O-acetyltransferase type A
LWEQTQEVGGRSFSMGATYAALGAANEIEAFRLRIRGDKVWLHDSVGMSTTILRPDEMFSFALFPMTPSFADFESVARAEAETARRRESLYYAAADRDDVIFHSTIPWIRFSALSNPIGCGKDCIPRIVFGRCTDEEGPWRMPVSVEVHHSLVDGLDVARFFDRFEQRLESFAWV